MGRMTERSSDGLDERRRKLLFRAWRRGVRQQSLLSAYWIPINFQGSAILAIAVPAALLTISGANHTAVLATLIAFHSHRGAEIATGEK